MKKIALNFVELILSKSSIIVPYLLPRLTEDNSEIKKLREDNSETFFSHSREKLFFWGIHKFKVRNQLLIDRNKDENDSRLFSKIIKDGLLTQFYKNKDKFKIKKDLYTYKITLVNEDVSNGKYKGLTILKNFHIHFTALDYDENYHLGFTVATSISVRCNWKEEDFIKNGIEPDGLKFDEETGEVYTHQQARYLLSSHFNYASRLKDDLDKLNASQNEYEDINNFVRENFEANINNISLPNDLKIVEFKKTCFPFDSQQGNFQNKILDTPDCFFYQSKCYATNPNNRKKIGYNKPFTYDDFDDKEINISIIYPKHLYTKVGNFIIHVQRELDSTFKVKKEKLKYSKFEIDDFSLSSYKKILASVKSSEIVIVVVDESHEALTPNNSPYYFCKSEFIKRGITTQEVQIQQIEKFLSDKKSQIINYTDHNIALNIYAKLGGMGWTIKPNLPKNELVIGIGATTDKEGQPILGLTSVFRGDGKYLLGKVFSVTGMKDYRENLQKIVSSTIDKGIEDGIIETDKPISLIFHIFKPAGEDNEIKALQNVIANYPKYDFEYSFVHIGDGHNYRFFTFDEVNNKPKFEIKGGFGQNQRGTFIKINDRFGFLGLRSNSAVFLRIGIDKRSNCFDLEYIANQVYQFAEMSHTSYNKSGKPVTIKYPSLMAGFAEKFSEIIGFYPEEIGVPDNSLWFI